MKNISDGLIRRLDMAEERISELENMPVEASKTVKEKLRNETGGKTNKQTKTKTNHDRMSENYGTTTRDVTCITEISEGEERNI